MFFRKFPSVKCEKTHQGEKSTVFVSNNTRTNVQRKFSAKVQKKIRIIFLNPETRDSSNE